MLKISFAVAALLASVSTNAHAANTRTWISGKGTDSSGCGPVASPCRTLQYAVDNTNAGGEVDVLDAAGYGSVYINKSINIINDGVGVAGVLAAQGGDGIIVNTGASDQVTLRGLTIEGAGIGANGIAVIANGTIVVTNCFIQGFVGSDNFHGNGILITTGLGNLDAVIKDTTITNNTYIGISWIPAANGALQSYTVTGKISIDHVTATYNKLGIAAYNRLIQAGAGDVHFDVSNSFVSHNSSTGIQAIGLANPCYTSSCGSFFSTLHGNLVTENGLGMDLEGSGRILLSANRVLSNNDFSSPDIKVTDPALESTGDNYFRNGSISASAIHPQ